MTKHFFSSYALTKEFDLNEIAKHFDIDKKYKWEDYLILNNHHLRDFVEADVVKLVYIYSFGSVTFINFSAAEIASFIRFLEKGFNMSKIPFVLKYVDEYELEINPDKKLTVSNDYTICPTTSYKYIDIISLILSRSVSLDKIENGINAVIDEVEDIIEFLEIGKLNIKDKTLAKLASKILGFKYTSISYIMLLDKPEITWENTEIDDFYYELIELFEVEDRYEQMQSKLDTLMDITEVFASLVHETRSARLEWIIIILIAVEFLVALLQLFFKL